MKIEKLFDSAVTKSCASAILLTAIGAAMLRMSWRKWPDVLVDYGRELYVPWRLNEGEVLYRDILHFYGPLSDYLNAFLFKVFGTSMMTLVFFNIALVAALTYLIYRIFSATTDRLVAAAASATFLTAFAFSQNVITGNYNYVCPYSYEVTHGMALSFLAIYCFVNYLRKQAASWLGIIGFSLGMIFLCKMEIFLSAILAIGAGFCLLFIIERMPPKAIFKILDLETKAKIFENLEFEEQNAILRDLDKKEAAQIVSNMSTDEATDLLERLPPRTVNNLLPLVESSRAKKLSTLLGYSGDSAGGLMTTEFVSLHETTSVQLAIDYIKNNTKEYDTVPYLYIVDDKNHLKGVTTIRRLLFADPKDSISKTAFQKTLHVYLNNSAKEIAYFMDKYKVSAIPVIDENKVILQFPPQAFQPIDSF